MSGKGKYFRNVLIMAFSICLLTLGVTSVYAADTYSLTLEYGQEGTIFFIYHVADYDCVDYVLTEEYQESNVAIPSEDSWSTAADSLAEYVKENELEAEQSGNIGNGSLIFSELPTGLYLVTGNSILEDGYTYMPVPFLVLISCGDVTSVVKSEVAEENTSDTGSENSKNESGVDGEDATDNTGTGTTDASGSGTQGTSSSKLPQTGQLWFPVFLLAAAGIICIIVGCFKTKKPGRDK